MLSSTHIVVNGASGRMGTRLRALAALDPSLVLHAAIDTAGTPGTIPIDALKPGAQVIIDFSSPSGARAAAGYARAHGVALLVGTTGLDQATEALLRETAGRCPVLLAANTSLGVAVLADAAARVARALGPGFNCSIVEAHHAQKKDAPSGTAKRLAQAVRGAGGALAEDQVLAIRGGDVVGEHTVRFAGPGEYLELTHRATSRDLFALGALRAAKWLAGRPAGWYTIEQALGLAE